MKKAGNLTAMCLIAGLATPALAEEQAEAGGIADIIVTAQKRRENLIDVPIAMSVVDADALAARGVTRFDELSRTVPSLAFEPGATPNENSFSLRGISAAAVGQGQQSSVGVYVDGIYLTGRSALNLDLFDVERIEILRGPQGTLFGRNTVAGALSIISRRPGDALSGSIEGEYGNYDLTRIRASIGGAVGGGFYAQAAANHVDRDGYVRNEADGSRLQGGSSTGSRFYLGYRPDDGRLSVEIIGDYAHEENGSGLLTENPFERRVAINAPNRDERTVYGVSATINYDLPGATLTSITGYRAWEDLRLGDTDASIRDEQTSENRGDTDSVSQEVRLASSGNGPFEWLIGGYYYREVNQLDSAIALTFPTPFGPTKFSGNLSSRLVERSIAGFGQASYVIAPALKLTVGGRASRDRQSITGVRTGFIPFLLSPGTDSFSTRDTDVSLKGAIQYEPSDKATFYATVAEGYKSAGINASALPPSLADRQVFAPERSINYEAGFKGSFLDRALNVAIAGFYISYDDLQVFRSDPITFSSYVSNAERARSYGAEIELRARVSAQLDLSGSLAINRTRYIRFRECAAGVDCDGNRLANAPAMTGSARADYRIPLGGELDLLLGGDVAYVGTTYFEPTNVAQSRRSGYAIVNASVTLAQSGQGWSIVAYAKNLTDKDYFTDVIEAPLTTGGSVWRYLPGTPRTYGVRLRYGF